MIDISQAIAKQTVMFDTPQSDADVIAAVEAACEANRGFFQYLVLGNNLVNPLLQDGLVDL